MSDQNLAPISKVLFSVTYLMAVLDVVENVFTKSGIRFRINISAIAVSPEARSGIPIGGFCLVGDADWITPPSTCGRSLSSGGWGSSSRSLKL